MTIYQFLEQLYTKHIDKKVEKYYQVYYFDMGENHTSHNNEGDAFKHTYLSAELALYLGQYIAQKIGYKHEMDNSLNNPEEMAMDLFNNEIGRQIALEIKKENFFWFLKGNIDDIIAEKVMDEMRNNVLITKP